MELEEKNNVISLADRKKEHMNHENDSVESQLDEIIRKNKENEERMRRERIRSNISVLKSYRIKKN